MKIIQKTGLYIFLFFLGLFIILPFTSHYRFDPQDVSNTIAKVKAPHASYLESALRSIEGQEIGGKFAFFPKMNEVFKKVNEQIAKDIGVDQGVIEQFIHEVRDTESDGIAITASSHEKAVAQMPENIRKTVSDYTNWLIGRTYPDEQQYQQQVNDAVQNAISGYVGNQQIAGEDKKAYLDVVSRTAAKGIFWNYKSLFFFLIYGVGMLGALMYIIPQFFEGEPGIKNHRIFHDTVKNRGIPAFALAVFLISFYIFLYKIPYLIQEWIALTDPASQLLRGENSSQWFMYGFMYTVAILVMGGENVYKVPS